ncbi:hypothetical protein QUV83_10145 [Cellulomonas cellasea]|uniref:hypothetical protein n=1 Tax=Cellulomonas cellasea TaxID=43670 RepID=UPI0025A3DCE8|nr:hypothetical protein [Cellulomonas cellasea]MDM8085125.1 hypothetical protein [Cellulomonas cellasea]
MRLGYDRPTTTCKAAYTEPTTGKTVVPCGCSKTVTVSFDDYARERQDELFGTTDWAASYGRRTAIEALNSELRTHRGMNIRRDWHTMRGARRRISQPRHHRGLSARPARLDLTGGGGTTRTN